NNGSYLRFGGTPLNGFYSQFWATYGGLTHLWTPYDTFINTTAGDAGFDGLLDEVAVYTNALPASAIAAHYAAAASPATYDATILAANPAGYWNFDESDLTPPDASILVVSANAGSLGTDADGTNEWGVLTAQPGPGYAGIPVADKALKFNGVSGNFNVKDAAGLHFSNTLTLTAWVKPTARDGVREIITRGIDDYGAETFLRIYRGSGYGSGYYYELGASDGAGTIGYYTSVKVPVPAGDLGNWVHLVGTYDGTNWNLYRNGTLAATLASTNGPLDTSNNWTIGSRGDPSDTDGFRFAGLIAEPAVFTNALTTSDVSSLYNAAQASPVITQATQNPGTVFQGSTVSFSVFAEGAPTLHYLWTTNGVSTGVTTTNYSIPNILAGTYTVAVIVTNAYGTNSSAVNFSVLNVPPTITTLPVGAARYVGYPFSFTVAASGSAPLTYYWKRGSLLVQAGSSATYSNLASPALAGSYSVIVSNAAGITVTSAPVTLAVSPVPGGYGGTVLGSGPIAYWRLNETSGSVAHDLIGGNDGNYYNATLAQLGYSVIDSDTAVNFSGVNSYVGDISGTAINFTGHTNFTLEAWVNAPATVTDNATIIAKGIGNVGATRTEQFALDVSGGVFRFFTTGNGNVLVQALANVGPDGAWHHVVGVYDDTGSGKLYIYVDGVLAGQGNVRAAGIRSFTTPVSIGSKRLGANANYNGTFGGAIDEVAIYAFALNAATVQAHFQAAYGTNLAPIVTIQPTPQTNYVGLPVSFSVAAVGSQPLTYYQWKRNSQDIAGANGKSFSIPQVSYADAGNYTVVISNNVGGAVSTAVPLVVLAPPTNPPGLPGLALHLPLTNTLVDVTGRGNNGTNVNSTYFVPDGPLGLPALHYSTDSTNYGTANYVTLGVRPDLKFGSNVSFSVAFWVRLPLNYQGGDLPFFADATNTSFSQGFVFAPSLGYNSTQFPGNPSAVDGAWSYSVFDAS
ncbi:MAG: LamG-like jellyroll fold domain-containing protein, partial [Verrucomicrobiota bacterium]